MFLLFLIVHTFDIDVWYVLPPQRLVSATLVSPPHGV